MAGLNMGNYEGKRVLVIGLGVSGRAAADLLARRGARVVAIDSADSAELRAAVASLGSQGVSTRLGASGLPEGHFDLAVTSPGIPSSLPWFDALCAAGIPVIGELELGYRESLCLSVAITGTDGKTTTTRLVEHMLKHCHKRTIAAGNVGVPICSVADQTKELDILTLEVSSFQLETTEFFRPSVAVVTNLAPDHLDRHRTMEAYIQAKGRIFRNQQLFDWAIIQSDALTKLRAAGVEAPSKVISYSATDPRADIYMDRSLLISRLGGWEGPLLDFDKCRLAGPHNAENCMAALAVGRVLRLPLEQTLEAVRSFAPLPHRCEPVAQIGGIIYVNDSKSTTMHSLLAALRSVSAAPGGRPNVWLIAGGKDKGLEYHDAGPLISQRVRGAYLIGETRERLRSAWSLFTPCALSGSLLEAVREAARRAEPGDVVLLSPACSSFDQFQDYQHRGDTFRQAVAQLAAG
ncbi:MAG: UDP-N-acetylmuramoyl-L-alanine--D-glutamate ligase [Verrucomicrobia bacterium]|nr:UDP-N-acetylmuramoyl-L-alanine--D-glutamate ligase [Verrucomicrobiota bacterium]MBI3867730.1 UDP-N-acetylmuramoyl-L-alanine--D-glutamate ligase [Verrucomicrobiota bacterium]